MPFGSGGGGGGLPLSGGTLTGPLVLAPTSNDVVPLTIRASGSLRGDDYLDIVDTDTAFNIVRMDSLANIKINAVGSGAFVTQLGNDGRILEFGTQTEAILSGALPTVAPVSATPFQCSVFRDTHLCIPFTGDATNNAATLKIELSPDNVTFSILDTLSIAAALNLTGAINTPVTILVPVAWYVKLTAVHGTIGTSTYY